METFRIGENYIKQDIPIEIRLKQHELLKQEIRDKLGLDDGYLCGFVPYDVIKINGDFYIRNMSLGEYDTYYTSLSQWRDGDIKKPLDGEVMCQCTNKTFFIEYGENECVAVCTQCKLKHVVYIG